MELSDLANWATLIGLPLAIVGIGFAGLQLRKSATIAEGEFMLHLEEMIAKHDEVHIKLRPGGAWTGDKQGPKNAEDWSKVEDYMGLFEHCELLIRSGSVSVQNFVSLFGYRLDNLMANDVITTEKLHSSEGELWHDFKAITKRVKEYRLASNKGAE